MRRRVKLSVLLSIVGFLFVIEPSVGLARTQQPTDQRTGEVSAQHPPNLEAEMATFRRQTEINRQAIDTLRAQFEERQAAVDTLTARLAAQLDQLRQHAQRQQYFVYGALGAIGVLGVAVLGVGWLLRTRLSVQDREEIRQEIRTTLRGHLITLQDQRERDGAVRQKVEDELDRVRQDIITLVTRVSQQRKLLTKTQRNKRRTR